MSRPARARPNPCPTCPYRINVPSGVWDEEEYVKLREYDGDTSGQSYRSFGCHQGDGSICAGWLGHRDPTELLAVRIGVATGELDPSVLDYRTDVPLFGTGAEAAAHGLAELHEPGPAAQAAVGKIVAVRRARLLRRGGDRS